MEPRTRNSYGAPRSMWRKWSELERSHFNHFFIMIYRNQELFNQFEYIDDIKWKKICRRMAMGSTDTVRRGMLVEYWRRKR